MAKMHSRPPSLMKQRYIRGRAIVVHRVARVKDGKQRFVWMTDSGNVVDKADTELR